MEQPRLSVAASQFEISPERSSESDSRTGVNVCELFRQRIAEDLNLPKSQVLICGDIDTQAPVVIFRDLNGDSVAALVQFTGHPVTSYHSERPPVPENLSHGNLPELLLPQTDLFGPQVDESWREEDWK